jgi:C-terminal processing protease CtpA/Prc
MGGGKTPPWSLVRVRRFEIRGISVAGLLALLQGGALPQATNLADLPQDGCVGEGLLKRFLVTFDYQHSRIFLDPTSNLNQAEPFNRSGIGQTPADQHWVVTTVHDGSPAAAAGVQVRDVILTVDGLDASHFPKPLREKWREPEGTHVHLRVKRGEQQLEIDFQLRDYLSTVGDP